MIAIRADDGNGCQYEAPDSIAGERSPEEAFSASFDQLEREVRKACARHVEWEARVSAGIMAVLEFAAVNPAETRVLTVWGAGRGDEVIVYFSQLLTQVAPVERRFPISTDRAVVESIAMMVRSHLLASSTDELPGLAPDMVYLALMPYTGLEGARREAERALVGASGR